jgi:spore coat protein CotH
MRGFLPTFLVVLSFCAGAHAQSGPSLFQTDKIQEVRISFSESNWQYILDSLRFNGDDLHAAATVRINGRSFSGAGLRFRDGRSHSPGQARSSMDIHLDFSEADAAYEGYRRLHLSSALRDPSMVREVLGYEIARTYMPAPLANYARVYINGTFIGLFVNVEPLGDAFLERNYGSANGSLFRASPVKEGKAPPECRSKIFGTLQKDNSIAYLKRNFTALRGQDWSRLERLTQVLQDDPEAIEQILDVDRALWMLAFNNVLVNLQSYTGRYSENYFLYYDRDSGTFKPGPADMNLAFGSFKNTGEGSDLRLKELETLSPVLHQDNPAKPLISQLLQVDAYRKRYLAHMRTIVQDYFRTDRYKERAEELQRMIRDEATRGQNPYYSQEDFNSSLRKVIGSKSRIPGLVSLMEARTDYLKSHPLLAIVPPSIQEVSVTRRERFAKERVDEFAIQARVDFAPRQVHIFYRFDTDSDFEQALLADDGKSKDGEAGDNLYDIVLTPPSGKEYVEYYLVAENAKAMSFSPGHYMYERHSHTLTEINQ